jgi:hypothetical protein
MSRARTPRGSGAMTSAFFSAQRNIDSNATFSAHDVSHTKTKNCIFFPLAVSLKKKPEQKEENGE